jgi:hypothetical protein
MNLHKSCQASALPSTRIDDDDDDDDFSFRNQAVRARARARVLSPNISVPEEE